MKQDTARVGKSLIEQIDALSGALAQIDTVIAESWPVTVKAVAPSEGASQPSGTSVQLPNVSQEIWKLAVTNARADLQTQIDGLNQQLTAL
jgi:hypothetical protein